METENIVLMFYTIFILFYFFSCLPHKFYVLFFLGIDRFKNSINNTFKT